MNPDDDFYADVTVTYAEAHSLAMRLVTVAMTSDRPSARSMASELGSLTILEYSALAVALARMVAGAVDMFADHADLDPLELWQAICVERERSQ